MAVPAAALAIPAVAGIYAWGACHPSSQVAEVADLHNVQVRFLVKDRRLERRPITAGTSEYEAVEGPSESDLVALPGDMALRDGMAVRSFIR
jgi:hypothetical protein